MNFKTHAVSNWPVNSNKPVLGRVGLLQVLEVDVLVADDSVACSVIASRGPVIHLALFNSHIWGCLHVTSEILGLFVWLWLIVLIGELIRGESLPWLLRNGSTTACTSSSWAALETLLDRSGTLRAAWSSHFPEKYYSTSTLPSTSTSLFNLNVTVNFNVIIQPPRYLLYAILDLKFDCDVATYNIFLFRRIQPTQPNCLRPVSHSALWQLGWVGWKCLFTVKN